MDSRSLEKVWNQQLIPVALRRTGKGELLRVRLPFAPTNGNWLRNGRRLSPLWVSNGRYWELPKAWFDDFVNRSLATYRKVYIIQPYREQEKCSPACQNAVGHECQCSCMGQHHGAGNDGSWFEVTDTFSTRSGPLEVACRLGALYASHSGVELTNIRYGLQRIAERGAAVDIQRELMARAESAKSAHVNSWQTAMYDALSQSEWFCAGGFD
jgi:hypothetical protein